ncbi:unnamed protein product [Amoebophrya sp. A25]|nr:unnamed protein product [Amoebophrya sp. A25]|eukprot:GSA25T00009051001.1
MMTPGDMAMLNSESEKHASTTSSLNEEAVVLDVLEDAVEDEKDVSLSFSGASSLCLENSIEYSDAESRKRRINAGSSTSRDLPHADDVAGKAGGCMEDGNGGIGAAGREGRKAKSSKVEICLNQSQRTSNTQDLRTSRRERRREGNERALAADHATVKVADHSTRNRENASRRNAARRVPDERGKDVERADHQRKKVKIRGGKKGADARPVLSSSSTSGDSDAAISRSISEKKRRRATSEDANQREDSTRRRNAGQRGKKTRVGGRDKKNMLRDGSEEEGEKQVRSRRQVRLFGDRSRRSNQDLSCSEDEEVECSSSASSDSPLGIEPPSVGTRTSTKIEQRTRSKNCNTSTRVDDRKNGAASSRAATTSSRTLRPSRDDRVKSYVDNHNLRRRERDHNHHDQEDHDHLHQHRRSASARAPAPLGRGATRRSHSETRPRPCGPHSFDGDDFQIAMRYVLRTPLRVLQYFYPDIELSLKNGDHYGGIGNGSTFFGGSGGNITVARRGPPSRRAPPRRAASRFQEDDLDASHCDASSCVDGTTDINNVGSTSNINDNSYNAGARSLSRDVCKNPEEAHPLRDHQRRGRSPIASSATSRAGVVLDDNQHGAADDRTSRSATSTSCTTRPSPVPLLDWSLIGEDVDPRLLETIQRRVSFWDVEDAHVAGPQLMRALREAAESGWSMDETRRMSWAARLAQMPRRSPGSSKTTRSTPVPSASGSGSARGPSQPTTSTTQTSLIGLVAFLLHVWFEYRPGIFTGTSSYVTGFGTSTVSFRKFCNTLRFALRGILAGGGFSSTSSHDPRPTSCFPYNHQSTRTGSGSSSVLVAASDVLFSFVPYDPWGIFGARDEVRLCTRMSVAAEINAILLTPPVVANLEAGHPAVHDNYRLRRAPAGVGVHEHQQQGPPLAQHGGGPRLPAASFTRVGDVGIVVEDGVEVEVPPHNYSSTSAVGTPRAPTSRQNQSQHSHIHMMNSGHQDLLFGSSASVACLTPIAPEPGSHFVMPGTRLQSPSFLQEDEDPRDLLASTTTSTLINGVLGGQEEHHNPFVQEDVHSSCTSSCRRGASSIAGAPGGGRLHDDSRPEEDDHRHDRRNTNYKNYNTHTQHYGGSDHMNRSPLQEHGHVVGPRLGGQHAKNMERPEESSPPPVVVSSGPGVSFFRENWSAATAAPAPSSSRSNRAPFPSSSSSSQKRYGGGHHDGAGGGDDTMSTQISDVRGWMPRELVDAMDASSSSEGTESDQ